MLILFLFSQGFRAKIRTNEPGTANYHPAHVSIYSEPSPNHIYASYGKYQQQPAYQQPEQATYDDSDHNEYDKTSQPSYDEQGHRSLAKSEHGAAVQNHPNDQEEQHYPQLDHQKYTYVPVYVTNNIDYKD